jgi:phosphoribosylformylglycinamidine synthase
MCIHGHSGAELSPEPGIDPVHWLFSESASRIVIALGKDDVPELKSLAQNLGATVADLGYVRSKSLLIEGLFEINIAELRDVYEGAFPKLMGDEALTGTATRLAPGQV